MVNHIAFNENSQYGNQLRQALTFLERGKLELNDLLGVMTQMLDGDGSQASHFDYMVPLFGFISNAKAKEAWEELNSVMAKLNTDASVSFVNAAMTQVFAKFG